MPDAQGDGRSMGVQLELLRNQVQDAREAFVSEM
jgi:hypothetical protein